MITPSYARAHLPHLLAGGAFVVVRRHAVIARHEWANESVLPHPSARSRFIAITSTFFIGGEVYDGSRHWSASFVVARTTERERTAIPRIETRR
jgi:hypothetical protein